MLLTLLLLVAHPTHVVDDKSSLEELRKAPQEAKELETWFYRELRANSKDKKKLSDLNSEYREKTSALEKRIRPLLVRYAKEDAAFDAIVAMAGMIFLDDQIIDIVRNHHFNNPQVVKLLNTLSQNGGSQQVLINDIAKSHPNRKVRGEITLGLARMERVYLLDALSGRNSFGGRLGPPDELRKRATARLERVIADYADLKNEDGVTYLELAKDQLAGISNIGRLIVGKPAIDAEGIDLHGKPLKMNATSGNVTMLVFWGTWCGPCMRLVPREVALAEKYKGQPFMIYGVNGRDEQKVAAESAKSKGMTWPSFFMGVHSESLSAVWGVSAWPTVFVIDHQGIIQYVGHGDNMEKAVEECMERLRAEKK